MSGTVNGLTNKSRSAASRQLRAGRGVIREAMLGDVAELFSVSESDDNYNKEVR